MVVVVITPLVNKVPTIPFLLGFNDYSMVSEAQTSPDYYYYYYYYYY